MRQADAGWVTGVDVDSIFESLASAVADDGERERRGQAARALASHFQWPEVAGQLVDLYRQVQGLATDREVSPRASAVTGGLGR